jgi:hypothetical protein
MSRNSVVGITTRYGLDDAGIESRWRGVIGTHTFRPTVELTQPPVQWMAALFPEDKAAGAWR